MDVQGIIDKFGSQTALAEELGIDQSAVSGWKRTGLIPAKRQQQLLDLAEQKDIDLSPADFFAEPQPEGVTV